LGVGLEVEREMYLCDGDEFFVGAAGHEELGMFLFRGDVLDGDQGRQKGVVGLVVVALDDLMEFLKGSRR
jgi:hypothetical protein